MSDLLHSFLPILIQAGDAAASAVTSAPVAEEASGWQVWIQEYGAIFIFVAFIVCGVGLHISEDFLLIPAGVAIHDGHMSWSETLIAAYFGLVIGDTLWIWVCRNYGTRLVHSKRFKRMMHPRRLLEAKYAMEERGVVVLILARFIPGTRTPVLTMTGILHMAWWKFLTVELTTVAITAPAQVAIGYFGKLGYERAKSLGNTLSLSLAGVAILVACIIGYRWWKQAKARKGPRPRAPVAWLRTFGR
ncbi:MAG: DedA family protein [Phycisphaerales bacterium]|jgi:membrane protein DedA with SNARE-associated domain